MADITLEQGLAALGLSLSEAQCAQLRDYLALVQKWNRVYNLTAVRNPQDMLTHHLLDSLAVVLPLRRHLAQRAGAPAAEHAQSHVENRPGPASQPARPRLLDVGSGAGLPGVVLAICCPELEVVCVDTVAKKAAFIQQAALSLKLPNLRGLHARVETLTEPFDVVCSRAFASLQDFTHWSHQALAQGGVWLAMKGKYPADELEGLQADVFHVEHLQVPGLNAERCLLWLKPKQVQAI